MNKLLLIVPRILRLALLFGATFSLMSCATSSGMSAEEEEKLKSMMVAQGQSTSLNQEPCPPGPRQSQCLQNNERSAERRGDAYRRNAQVWQDVNDDIRAREQAEEDRRLQEEIRRMEFVTGKAYKPDDDETAGRSSKDGDGKKYCFAVGKDNENRVLYVSRVFAVAGKDWVSSQKKAKKKFARDVMGTSSDSSYPSRKGVSVPCTVAKKFAEKDRKGWLYPKQNNDKRWIQKAVRWSY